MSKILIVDDEQYIIDLLSYNLEKEGFSTVKAYDGEASLGMIRSEQPALMILDLMLPKMNGLDVCKAIRRDPETANLPIIMLTAKANEVDKIIGLEIGADDYVTKPFSVQELIARVRTILRRLQDSNDKTGKEEFKYKELSINYASCLVQISGKSVSLSPTELKILFFLSSNPGKVYSRSQILDHVWSEDTLTSDRSVDVHIKRLRSQIENDMENPQYILTVRGFGYKFASKK